MHWPTEWAGWDRVGSAKLEPLGSQTEGYVLKEIYIPTSGVN